MRILVVVAHPDDEVLACGGSIHHEARHDNCVRVLILSSRGSDLNESARKAGGVLMTQYTVVPALALDDQRFDAWDVVDITKRVRSEIVTFGPDEVWTHSSSDINRDHRITHEAVMTATRPIPEAFNPSRVLAFECPSSTEYGMEGVGFFAQCYKEISSDDLDAKIEAMRCYPNEMPRAPHPRSPESLRALATWRGACAGVKFAEAFRIERCIE
jgi:LmbE family N-acetylglucosaminyl deacetylase